MKYFLGVILALVVVGLVFKLAKKPDDQNPLNAIPQTAMVATQPSGAPMHNVVIEEVIQASSYTYMRVKEDQIEYWVATIKDDAAVGGKYSYGQALEMRDFKSKELDRTFPVIFFISEDAGMGAMQQDPMGAPTTMGKPKVEQQLNEVIAPSAGGISIAELYKNRSQYANKKVKVKGKVVKVNPEVMDRNWVHLQDGTNDSGNFDLTVTTLESANVDDILEFEGTVVLNKDFGAGYVYELIMEGGVIRK